MKLPLTLAELIIQRPNLNEKLSLELAKRLKSSSWVTVYNLVLHKVRVIIIAGVCNVVTDTIQRDV